MCVCGGGFKIEGQWSGGIVHWVKALATKPGNIGFVLQLIRLITDNNHWYSMEGPNNSHYFSIFIATINALLDPVH